MQSPERTHSNWLDVHGLVFGLWVDVERAVDVAADDEELPADDQSNEDEEGLMLGRGVVTPGQLDSSAPSVAQSRFPSHTMDVEMQRLSDGHWYSAPTVQVKAEPNKNKGFMVIQKNQKSSKMGSQSSSRTRDEPYRCGERKEVGDLNGSLGHWKMTIFTPEVLADLILIFS
jgi:hypothetical protein